MVETLSAPHGTPHVPSMTKGYPRFTIITPTLLRDSLAKCCASVDAQTLTSWEHILAIDLPEADTEKLVPLGHPQRKFMHCGMRHTDAGNTCRHNAWNLAGGRYLIYLDDDNYLSGNDALERIWRALEANNFPDVAFFPIERLGQRFFSEPPRDCHVDTLNLVVGREIGQWPLTDAYGSDWVLIGSLIEKYAYAMFPNEAPIGVVPVINGGR